MNRLAAHRITKLRRRSLLWAWWLALPAGIRPGVFVACVLVVLIGIGSLMGCAVRPPDSVSGEILRQSENDCTATRNRLPGCIWGFFVFGKWNF